MSTKMFELKYEIAVVQYVYIKVLYCCINVHFIPLVKQILRAAMYELSFYNGYLH